MNPEASVREFQIGEQVALGKSKKEVANKFNISIYTVETTIKNLYQKYGFSKVQDLVLWYIGKKLEIADDISRLKEEVLSDDVKKQFFIVILALSVAGNGIFDMQYRVRRYRRNNEIEFVSPIEYPITA